MISTGVNARAFSRGVLSLDHIIARQRLSGPISRQLHLPVHMTHTPESQLATGQVEFEHAAETSSRRLATASLLRAKRRRQCAMVCA